MKKSLLALCLVGFTVSVFAQDCASFIRYYDQNYSFGMNQGGDPLVNFSIPIVTAEQTTSVFPGGDSIVCAGNVMNIRAGFEWIPSARIEVADAGTDSFLIAWKTDQFGSGGARGGLSGAAAQYPVGIFLDDPEGCLDPVVVPYPDLYFAGQIAFVSRGSCSFVQKASRAEDADAEATIIYNRAGEAPYAMVYMGGTEDPLIPNPQRDAWFTTHEQGLAVINEIDLEEREVLITLCDRKISDANWTKDGAPFTNPSQWADMTCTDGPGQYRLTDFTVDLGCGPIALPTDSVNQQVGPAPCGGQASCTEGIADDILNEKINIYPNPTTGLVTLSMEDQKESEVSVYSIDGRKVISEKTYTNETIEMDLSKLNTGLYFVKVKQNDAYALKRVQVLK